MKSIEIVMILGNRAIYLSNYTIPALLRSCLISASDYIINVRICLNGFNHNKYDRILCNILKYNELLRCNGGGVKFEDYKDKTSEDFILQQDGSYSCEGVRFSRPMFKGSDIWDFYFNKTTADYFAIIDDDCEILDKTLLKRMLDYMVLHNIDVFSADKTIMRQTYDTYSQANIVSMPRNDTWLCIYDMHQCRCDESFALLDEFISDEGNKYIWRSANWEGSWKEYEKHFRNEIGTRFVYDDSAYLQSIIKENTGKPYMTIHDAFDKDYTYIHYAHFASNTLIDSALRTSFYRKLILLGYKSRSKAISKFVNMCRRVLFGNADASRLIDKTTSQLD